MSSQAWKRLLVVPVLLVPAPASAGSVRFFGNGYGDIDRIKIRIDDPNTTLPGPPADVGATDFTIEMWLKGTASDNNNSVRCGDGVYGWIDGDIFFDRDRFDPPRAFGLALGNGRVAFGVHLPTNQVATLCGTRSIMDGQWHHVAVTRRLNGELRIFIDGVPDGMMMGPSGDISYPDDGQPSTEPRCGGQGWFNSDPFIVLGTEKHNARPRMLTYAGYMDELRISTTLRYTGAFTVPTQPFAVDTATAAL